MSADTIRKKLNGYLVTYTQLIDKCICLLLTILLFYTVFQTTLFDSVQWSTTDSSHVIFGSSVEIQSVIASY